MALVRSLATTNMCYVDLAMLISDTLYSHMLLDDEPLSLARYLHPGKPMIIIAMFMLNTTSWAVYSYVFLNETQGDNMAYYTQTIQLLAQGSMVMKF